MPSTPSHQPPDPAVGRWEQHRHRDLEQIAIASLRCARLLMETGSRAQVVHECCELLASGLGAELIGVRVGYASISVTLGSGANTITRMVTVKRHGVDHRLNLAIRRLVREASKAAMPAAEIGERLDVLTRESPRHPLWLVVGAVGLACAAFGQLLGTDAAAFLPVLLAGCIGQYLRHRLLRAGVNPYVATAATAFVAASVGGGCAHLAGSATVNIATIAATLLVVPGVPATNAQADILDGFPTLGSARAVSVLMAMVFATTGIWAAGAMFGMHP